MKQTELERVNQLQNILLKTSWLYEYGPKCGVESWISDERWDLLAKELLGKNQKGSAFDKEFEGFDGTSGMDLARIVESRRCKIGPSNCLTTARILERAAKRCR